MIVQHKLNCEWCPAQFDKKQTKAAHIRMSHPAGPELRGQIKREFETGSAVVTLSRKFQRSPSFIRRVVEAKNTRKATAGQPTVGEPRVDVEHLLLFMGRKIKTLVASEDELQKRLSSQDKIIANLREDNVKLSQELNDIVFKRKVWNEQLDTLKEVVS